jgi:uncharacterized membrane protein HdeD (DUF308 family)
MISYAVKGLDGNPVMSSTLLLAIVYTLSIAPNFTNDAYLKLLPVFLIPAVMIASSDATGFSMNIELLLGAGILTAGVIKIMTMFERTRERLKRPQQDKLISTLLYAFIFGAFMSFYVGIGMALPNVPLHAPQPQPKSAFYFLLIFIYIIITLANISGFKLSFGGNKSKSKDNETVVVDEEE